MNTEQIIKALERCSLEEENCKECPYHTKGCIGTLLPDALSLSKVQQAEIEILKKYNTDVAFKHYNDGKKDAAREIFEEIDTLIVRRMIPDIAWIDDRFITDFAELKKKYESEGEDRYV